MTPADRLRAAIHMESAAIAPQTSPLIEAAREVLAENERLRRFVGFVNLWCYRDGPFVDKERLDCIKWHPTARALHQQLSVRVEEDR